MASLQGRLFRVDTLAQGENWAGDPVAYAKQVNRTARLTPADVQRSAVKYLGPGRVVLSMVPAGKLDLISKPDRKYEKVDVRTADGGQMTASFIAHLRVRPVATAVVAISLGAGLCGAQQLDRSKRPEIPPRAPFVFPTVRSHTLANGLSVRIVENHALPLVAVRVAIEAGSLLDPEGKDGLFTLDTLLMRDGTTSMTGRSIGAGDR